MTFKPSGILAGFFMAVLTLGAAQAATINTGQQPNRCLCAPNDLGQSFLAEDPFVNLTVYVGDVNTHLNPGGLSIVLTFFSGAGPGGTLLGTFDVSPAVGSPITAKTVDLTTIPLTPGEFYSFFLHGAGGRGLTEIGDTVSVYANGVSYWEGQANPDVDMSFIVTPTDAPTPAPEPASMALLGLGLAGLGLTRRARRT